MADLVITRSSTVMCQHPGSSISPKGVQSKLKIAGNFVLVDGDLTGATVSSCPIPDNTNTPTKKCRTTLKQTAGPATKLKVEGDAVLLEGTKGKTDGLSGQTIAEYSVSSAGQAKLKAD